MSIQEEIHEMGLKARAASGAMRAFTTEQKNAALAAIADALPEVPLVLHGGSGTPLADVCRAIESGIAKVNIATEFLDGYIKSTLKVFGDLNGAFVPPDKLADPIIDSCSAHVARLIRFFAGK